MGQFEQQIHSLYDQRIGTLGRIKTRSVNADVLTLTALRVLVYSQLEGGVKEQVAVVLRHLNAHPLQIGEIPPSILQWRNNEILDRFRAALNFENFVLSFPFGNLPSKRVKIRPLNRIKEFNQMNSESLGAIYTGLGLDKSTVTTRFSDIDDLVGARNDAAHHGIMPKLAINLLEGQVRGDATMVEMVLTDVALQALSFFTNQLHRR